VEGKQALQGPDAGLLSALLAFLPKRLFELGSAAVLSLLFRGQFHGERLRHDEEKAESLPSAKRRHVRRGDPWYRLVAAGGSQPMAVTRFTKIVA
jgi:hypothetical protein